MASVAADILPAGNLKFALPVLRSSHFQAGARARFHPGRSIDRAYVMPTVPGTAQFMLLFENRHVSDSCPVGDSPCGTLCSANFFTI